MLPKNKYEFEDYNFLNNKVISILDKKYFNIILNIEFGNYIEDIILLKKIYIYFFLIMIIKFILFIL